MLEMLSVYRYPFNQYNTRAFYSIFHSFFKMAEKIEPRAVLEGNFEHGYLVLFKNRAQTFPQENVQCNLAQINLSS